MDTFSPRLYARGYFLGPRPVDFLDDIPHFHRIELPGVTCYADEIVEVGVATEQGEGHDDWLVTIGKILPLSTGVVHSRGPTIAEELFAILQRDGFVGLQTALYDLGGRHAIIMRVDGNIYAYNDAAGHRTVYFNHTQQRIASHFDMLHRLAPAEQLCCPVESRNTETSPDGLWDLTEHPQIRALLPNHRLELSTGSQPRFGLTGPNPHRDLTWQQRIECIHALWQEQLEQIFALSPERPVGVSLSGGLDSRTVLSQLRSYRSKIRAFTYTSANVAKGTAPTTFWQRTMTTDHNVLAQLRDHLPADFHVLVKPRRGLEPADAETLERNAIRNHGQPFVPLYKELFPDVRSIHVRGNMVEMGRLIRGQVEIPTQRERLAQVAQEIIRRRRPNPKAYRKFFWHKAEALQYDHIHADFEYTDAYHWENRSARWYAEIANETDTVFDSIVPVNVRRLYELLVSPPVAVRPSGQLQYDLIHHAWPELLAYGINTEDDLYTTTLREHLTTTSA